MQHINPTGSSARHGAARLRLDPSLFYDPPYERPLEDTFIWHLIKYLNPVDAVLYQARAVTPCAPCWVDFVVEQNGRRIAFEIGDLEAGADERQEALRDALVVGSGAVDTLYRLRGADVLEHPHEVLHLIARWEPGLFSHRGHVNLRTLAAPAVRDADPGPDADVVHVVLDDEADVLVRRYSRTAPATWVNRYDEALAVFDAPRPARSA
ncbi:hypothetical protein AWN76_013840 [Rhodothermaceae bacterium RA]|nr:hypothetical protein AWN76_013840 [Rhodothermaceae bacterium RA]